MSAENYWPDLRISGWEQTEATLHRMMQIVGKTALALAPPVNHWWQVTFHVSGRGLATHLLPLPGRGLDIEFDFLSHGLRLRTSDGGKVIVPLSERPVAEFYRDYVATLRQLAIEVPIWPKPVEMPDARPFDTDVEHRTYDPTWVEAFYRALVQSDRVLREFRSNFIGKASPVHFFWGSADLAATRFSGRRAPPHPSGGFVADSVTQEAYSHEVSSAGFWPGADYSPEAIFYSYAYPEPPGFASAPVRPAEASYDETLHEFVLPYEAARTYSNPDRVIREFLESTYEAVAELGDWDRDSLERSPEHHHHGRPGESGRYSRRDSNPQPSR